MKWVIFGLGVVVLGALILIHESSGIKDYWEITDLVNQKMVEEISINGEPQR
jgi:hypothetical protein